MPLFDDLEQKYGLPPNAVGNINKLNNTINPNGGGLFGDLQQKYGSRQQPKTQQPQQPTHYQGEIINKSPLTNLQRGILQTPEDVEGKKNILRNMGFEPLEDKDGNLLVRSGDKVYRVDEKGISIGDLAELFGQGLTTIAGVGGAVVGGIAGSVVPGVGTAAGAFGGAAVGGSIAAGIAEWASQKIGQRAGSQEETQVSDILEEAAFGALNSIGGFGGSTLAKLGIRTASQSAKEAAEIAAREVLKRGGSKVTAKLTAQHIIESDLRKTFGGRILSEATEGAIGGGLQSGGITLYETGDPVQALKAAGLGVGLGGIIGGGVGVTPLSRLGYKNTQEIEDIANRSLTKQLQSLRSGQSRATIKEIEDILTDVSATDAEKTLARELLDTYKAKPQIGPEPTYRPIDEDVIDTGLPRISEDTPYQRIETPTKELYRASATPFDKTKVGEFGISLTSDRKFAETMSAEGIVRESGDLPGVKSEPGQQTVETLYLSKNAKVVEGTDLPKSVQNAKNFTKAAAKYAKENNIDAIHTVSGGIDETRVYNPDMLSSTEPRLVTLLSEDSTPIIKRGAQTPESRKPVEEGLPVIKKEGVLSEEELVRDERLPIIKEGELTPEEKLPIVDYGPTEEGEVDLDDYMKKLGIEKTRTLAEENSTTNKFVDWIMTPFDSITNPNNPTTRLGRTISSAIGRLGSIISSVDEVGKKLFKDLTEIIKVTARFNVAAKKALNVFGKTRAKMSKFEYEQWVWAMQQNNAENPDRIFKIDDIKSKLLTTTLQRQATDEWFEVTKYISESQTGRLFKDAQGNISRVAKEPSVFFPIRALADDNDDVYRDALQKQMKKLMDNGMSENEARFKAESQLEHRSFVGAGEARKKHYSSFQAMVDAGVNTDIMSVGEKWIAANSRPGALLEVVGKQAKYLEGADDLSADALANKYMAEMVGELQKGIDKWVISKKMGRNEAIALSKLLKSQIDVVLNGKQIGETVKQLRSIMAFRLSLSAIKNVFQPLFLSMENDMPSMWKGLRVAYAIDGEARLAKTDPELYKMFKTPEGYTTKAGSGVEEITEGVLDSADDTMMTKVLNFILKPLRWTEERNRIAASISGANYARTLRDSVNNASTSPKQRRDSARRLGLLINRDIDMNTKVVFSEDDYMNAAYNNTKATQFGYDPLQLPWFANTPAGTLGFQFKSFAYNQTALLWRNTVDEVRSGNIGRASRNFFFLAAIMGTGGEVARAMDNILYGDPDETDQNIIERWIENIAMIGSFGLLTDALRTPDGKTLVLNYLAGPTGSALAQTWDLGRSILSSDGLGDTLEDTFNFALKQTGGAGRVVRGALEGESGIGKILR